MSHVCGPPTLRGKCQVREFSDVGNLAEYMESENSFFYCHGYKPESRWECVCCAVKVTLCAMISVLGRTAWGCNIYAWLVLYKYLHT